MQTVVGLFDTADKAQQAVTELKNSGVTSDNIDISYNNSDNLSEDGQYSGDFNDSASSNLDTNGGSKVGNFFKNLFGDNDDEANRYSHVAGRAGCIVTVHADSKEDAEMAADVLDNYGAVNVDDRAAEYGYQNTSGNNTDADSLKVIKEDVQIGKKEVETGGMRLRSRIVERPVEESLRLREEKVTVQRTPVDRVATDDDLQNFKEGQIEMTETQEVPLVSKEARVVEEVKLSKNVTQREQTIRETARDTQVDAENIPATDNKTNNKGKM